MLISKAAERVPRLGPAAGRPAAGADPAFVTAYQAGDDDRARALYPRARIHWEAIETVAESFGDLDPKTDAREADLEQGQKWTGWHRIEKDLWPQRAKGYTAADASSSAQSTPTTCSTNVTTRPRQDPRAHLHHRPDRQRLLGPDGGGRDRAR